MAFLCSIDDQKIKLHLIIIDNNDVLQIKDNTGNVYSSEKLNKELLQKIYNSFNNYYYYTFDLKYSKEHIKLIINHHNNLNTIIILNCTQICEENMASCIFLSNPVLIYLNEDELEQRKLLIKEIKELLE